MMNRLYTLLLVIFPVVVNAQEAAKSFQLGFTVSPNLAWAKINESNSKYSADGLKPGFTYGVIGDFGFAKNYFFSTAFTITSINSKIKLDSPTSLEQGETTYKIQYLDIPLTLKLKTNQVNNRSFYGQFGLGTGIKVRARMDATYKSSAVESSSKNNNIGSSTNVFRLGLIAGGGVEWHYNENSKLLTGVTFNNGFTDVRDSSPFIRNSFVALNLGILF